MDLPVPTGIPLDMLDLYVFIQDHARYLANENKKLGHLTQRSSLGHWRSLRFELDLEQSLARDRI